MKLFRILSLLLLVSSAVYSQDWKIISLEIKNLDDDSGYCGNVYYATEYGCSNCFQCMDGNVEIRFFPFTRLKTDRAYISFREDKSNVANISIECLLACNSAILLSSHSVRVTACKSASLEDYNIFPNSSCVEPKQFSNLHDDYDFFPKKIIRSFNDDNRLMVNWFSWNLKYLGEPILRNRYPNDVYRFTWISNIYYYDYDPYSIRIEAQEDGSAILYFSCENQKENSNEKTHNVSILKPQHIERFMQIINEIDLEDKAFTENFKNQEITNILEVNVNGRYHVIFRGEGEDPALDELQKFLWSLTGLGENKIAHKRQRIE